MRLRPWRGDDARALAAAWRDPAVARWSAVPADTSADAARRWIALADRRRASGVALDLVVAPPDRPGTVWGEVGLADLRWDRRGAQVGYWIAADARGRGRAVRGLRLLADWALITLGLDVLVARCHADNVASQRVASAAGFARGPSDTAGHVLFVRVHGTDREAGPVRPVREET